ncbi:MAG: MerR family transcriptional regulator [Candidatus Kapabacteria bacterium]|nr:MerR family transcriptional regulator [Candidatus Kapabacteria bacterium]
MRKLYYSISEISDLVSEEQHILRYWEKEFSVLSPKKNRAGNRIYSPKDLFIIQTIKKFLRSDMLSLKATKERIDKLELNLIENDRKTINIKDNLNENISKEINEPINLTETQIKISHSDLSELAQVLKEIYHSLEDL